MKSYFALLLLIVLVSMMASANAGRLDDLKKMVSASRLRNVEYDAVYNIGPYFYRKYRLGSSKTSSFVTAEESFTGSRWRCRQQGVLKVTLSNSTTDKSRSRVLIDMVMYRPSDYVFNVGDSRSNDGKGGDNGTQTNDAEVVGSDGNDFKVYLNQDDNNTLVVNKADAFKERVSLLIGDGELVWLADSGKHFNYYLDSGLFALNDQTDASGSENFDIYIGVNRAIKQGTSNTGRGVCSIGIKFEPALS